MTKNKYLGLKKANIRRTCLIMRVFFLFFTLGIGVCFSNNSYSQSTKISLHLKNKTVKQVFSEIEKSSGFIFFYQDDILDADRKVTVNADNEIIEQILNEILSATGNTYFVSDRSIYIIKKPSHDITNKDIVQQQKKQVTGTITDKEGEAIIGANIIEKGTTNGTVTDVNGNFTLKVENNAVLQISYIGYLPQEINATGKTTFNITLVEDTQALEELVVVGYGTQKKASIIGSIATIEPKKLITSNANLSNNLAGQLAGILAVQRSGEPGSDQSDFWIRGVSTFNAGSQQALVLVDGVERNIDDVDPLDIESFSILKDATATAIYGVKGANGVILINTKKGTTGEPSIQIRFESNMNAPVKLVDYVDGVKYMQIFNEACRNVGIVETYSQEAIDQTRLGKDPDLYPNVDWMNEVFRDFAQDQKINLNISGGGRNIRYYVSGGYLHQNGILKTNEMEDKKSELKFDRFNFRSNIDIDLSKTTLFQLNLAGFYKEKRNPGYDLSTIFEMASAVTPISYPKIYSDGSYAHLKGTQWNPWMASTHSGYQMNEENQVESSISLQQKLDFITKGLSMKGLFSFDAYNNQTTTLRKTPTTYYATGRDMEENLIFTSTEEGTDYIGLTGETNASTRSTYLEVQLNYQRTFYEAHNVSGLLLYNQHSKRIAPASSEVGSLPYRNNGIAGRLTYNYDERYFIEGNFGYNGSENFAAGKRYGFFPSLAIGWYISQEPFYNDALRKYMHKLKLKASSGLVGNDQISTNRRFGYLTLFSTGLSGYSWGADGKYTWTGVGVNEYGDTEMSWEKARKTNVGVEFGMLNMIDLNIDYYWENRNDIYMRRNSIPATTGIKNLPYGNVGKMSNHGVDMSLIVNKQITKSLFLSVNSSFTFARNKITEMDEPDSKYSYQNKTGKRYGQLFGLVAEKLYADDNFNEDGTLKDGIPVPAFMNKVQPGDIKYVDVNRDMVINDYDQIAIGYSAIPEIVYGFGATIQYKKFDLGFLFQGTKNTSLLLGQNSSFFYPAENSGIQGNIYANIDDRWTVDNPRQDVFWPRLYTGGTNNNNRQPSTWWLRDASFCRLKNVEVGYNIKLNITENKIIPMRVYLRGTNLLTFSKSFKDLWDPELNSTDGMSYPINKIVALGMDINF
ncbi:TonB-dependent receptor [uncultured Proteiniphilum sp.]|uniref:TonB-dependent receptor n=1 Tax=uncultured Proteiniphilum sp. TaxID=497637 RepID=UPI002622B6D6|nr:TonB-dependent receptor [uncultured Proteiniphilum sp.]